MKKIFKQIDKKKVFFIFVLFLCFSLQSFAPRDEEIFSQNCLRFLKNGDYKLLESYFLKYFSQVHTDNLSKEGLSNSKNSAKKNREKNRLYLITIAVEIPLPSIKKSILLHSLEIDPSLKELHCYLGEQFLFEKEYEEAEKNYQLCSSKKKLFYLAQIAEKQNKNKEAISLYQKILLSPFDAQLKNETAINLSRIYLELGDYQKSLSLAKKIKSGVVQLISLFKVYQAMKEEELMDKTLKKIKKNYASTLEAKAFFNYLGKTQENNQQ